MAISSSLYSSISGLSTMGEAMSILGDNVANTNTLSFKASRTTFQDVLAQSVSTASGAAQVGRGVTMSTVDGLFAQGSFETSSTPTDMAIGGQGFFMLRASGSSEADMYSRAGEFRFDQEGLLVNPMGHFVQGWGIDVETQERAGSIGDIRIDKTTPPVETLTIEMIANLDSREANEVNDRNLFDSWNGTNAAAVNPTAPIDPQDYEYTSSIKVYDSKGASHDISIYFDRTSADNQWEFLVTSDPAEDMRVLDSVQQEIYPANSTYDFNTHKGAGALLYGVIQFDTSGRINEIAAYDVPPDGEVNPSRAENRVPLDNTDLYHKFEANFTGATENQEIELNLGAQYNGQETPVSQVLVSDFGAFSDITGTNYITAETLWASVFDQTGSQLTGDGTAVGSDNITVTGFKNNGERAYISYDVDSVTGGKVQDFLTDLGAAFDGTATIDSMGRLKLTDNDPGGSGLFITSFVVTGDGDPVGDPLDDSANPFGDSGGAMTTILNITTPKRKIFSQGQGLSAGGLVPVVTANTLWANVYSAEGGGTAVTVPTTFTFDGFNGANTAVGSSFDTATGATGTVQDLLDAMENAFDCDVEIDTAGRIVLTDRLADDSDYTSFLAITDFTTGAGDTNPWDDLGAQGVDSLGVLHGVEMAGTTAFLELDADTSGGDGSEEGGDVSSDFSSEALSTTQYANSSTTIFQDQNGFASGFLQSVSVDTEGVITGNYSNGQVLAKAQVALANFASLAGLFKEGGNVYRETTDSGAPVTSVPGTNGLGTIAPNALEQSNVDLGTEFVKLITVQRAFQANSKIITTTDEMLNDLINIKR
jgi:flagellar hook-basal body protein